MINKSIVIAALARDCNVSLMRNIPCIEQLRNHFAHSTVVVVENDSKDNTKQTLKKWANQSENVHLIMNDFGTQTIPQSSAANPHPSTSLHRIEKMAHYRNMYMDYIRTLEPKPDYLIIIDVDVQSFSVEGIINAIENAPSDWGGLFANGQRFFHGKFPYFFDLFAYVSKESQENFARKNDELYYESRRVTKQLRTTQYLQCLSAFGGIGVYKWEAIKNKSYIATKNDRSKLFEAVCEHVPFNISIVNQGYTNYVCQMMKLCYGTRSFSAFLTQTILPIPIFKMLYKLRKGVPYGD